jgi:hypothetical protein
MTDPRSYPPEAVLKPDQVAEWLDVSKRTLQRLKIPSVLIGHRTVRYLARDVLRYLEGRSR